jgi:membrane associated rhomboid family serine protease
MGTTKFSRAVFHRPRVSSLGTVFKQKNNPDYASLGASGAILSVLFAYIVYRPLDKIYLYFAIGIPAVLFAFGYLAYSWWASGHSRDRVNHDAHLDGALTGSSSWGSPISMPGGTPSAPSPAGFPDARQNQE